MARTATIIGFILVVIILVTGPVAAADGRMRMDEPFEITADRIHFDDASKLYVAEGRVRIDQADRRLKARWLAFSTETRIGVAEGDVQVVDGEEEFLAEFMVFDVDSLQGMLFQGALDAGGGGFLVRAKELVRTGRNTFTIEDGVFTTCRCEPGKRLPWEIHSAEANLELGGYGTIKNSTFNVLGVPVLWIPWAFFPVKSDRETGLLLPEFGVGGRGGAQIGLPFFWAALPQLNVTATPRYFVDRGFKQDLELEYVFGEKSEGRLFGAGLSDRLEAKRGNVKSTRWAVLWEHDQTLPAKWRWQTDLKLSSDNLYADDFLELREFRSNRFIESTSNFARDFGQSGGVGAMLGARYADNVQGSSKTDRDGFVLQRFAELRGDIQPGAMAGPFGFEARVDSELIYFSGLSTAHYGRNKLVSGEGATLSNGRFFDFGPDGQLGGLDAPADPPDLLNPPPDGDGVFQPGELLAERGARLVVHPRIARSFQLGHLAEFVPELGWSQTLYRSTGHNFAERGLLTARADLRMRLSRDYFGEGGKAMRHVIEPRLGWAFVSQQQQQANPLFIPTGSVPQTRLRSLSLENVTRNPSDRIDETNKVVLALGQRFFGRDRAGQSPRLWADLTTAIDWDFADHGGGLGNVYVEGRLLPVGPVGLTVRGAFDPEKSRFDEGEVGATLQLPTAATFLHRASLGITYRVRGRLPQFFESVAGDASDNGAGDSKLNQLDWAMTVELTERIRMSLRAVHTFEGDSGFIRSRGVLEYVSKCRCWGVGVSAFHEREQGFGGGFEIRLIGLGGERSSLFKGGLGAGLDL